MPPRKHDHVIERATVELVLEAVEMLVAFREHQRRAAVATASMTSSTDAPIPRLVVDQLLIERLKLDALVRIGRPVRLERRRLNEDEVLERARRRLCASVHAMPNRAALHEDDRMMAVLAGDGRRQSNDESGLRLPGHLLEAVRRQMMALVDDHMAVFGDAIIHDALADQTLNDADVNVPVGLLRPPPIRPIDFAGISRNVDSRSTH